MRPHAAQNLNGGISRPTAPATSVRPVMNTSRSGRGSPGGTIAMSSLFMGAKCDTAVNRNIVASATRALCSHVVKSPIPANPSTRKNRSDPNKTKSTCTPTS